MSQNHYKCGRTNALGVHCTDSYVIKNVITLINTINAVIINKYISISKLTKGSLHLSLGSVIGFWQVFQSVKPVFVFLHQEMKQKQKAQEEINARTQPLPLPDVVPDGDPQQAHYGIPALNGGPIPLGGVHPAPGVQQPNRNHGLLGGALANLFVIVGFAAFAYTVKYVLRSIAQE